MFCLNYYHPARAYLNSVEEIRLKYNPVDRTLPDFLKEHSSQSIVIDVADNFLERDAKLFSNLIDEQYHNFKLIINFLNKEHYELIKKYQLPFFFTNAVTTIDQLNGYISYHPTDMYICEELGFSLDKVSELLHSNNIKVRVYPNICQSSFKDTPSIQKFFIRPEDIPAYELFVDVFELIDDEQRQEVLYKIYKQQKWFGKISELIPTFQGDLDSKYLLTSFGMIRTKCRKRCMYNPHSCSVCRRFMEAADMLKENKIAIHRQSQPVNLYTPKIENETKEEDKEV